MEYIKTSAIALGITTLMVIGVFAHYRQIAGRPGTIVLPAGGTYLGSRTMKGNIYPYTFSIPTSLTLTTFKNDPYDIYAVVQKGVDPASNVLIGIDTHATSSGRTYVETWWKQFAGLTGASSIEQFENANDLKGYKAKYINSEGKSPNTDVFFEVPGHPTYVIHLASGILDPSVFYSIVDSVGWDSRN